MSVFYQSMSKSQAMAFKKRKKAFKKGKPCAICGKTYPSDQMMVAHIIPVTELTDAQALYDTRNWSVRCIWCERAENTKKDRSFTNKS